MAEQNALQAFASVPKLIMAILEFIMKMKDLTIKNLESKLENEKLGREDDNKLSKEQSDKAQSEITKLKGEIADINKALEEYKRTGDPRGLIQLPEAQKILKVKNDMENNPTNGKGKNVWFDDKGDFTNAGLKQFVKKATRESLGFDVQEKYVQKVIEKAQEVASKQTISVNVKESPAHTL